ncbi:hypothetical protein [Streptomyces sp. Ru87]|uniref:hypothetical protein n=1 Tax=Streptomyces sp. Ru87 TaxID=2044307 RepID=UPI0015D484AD|nr:hypothetical protein [Streptomyces sp. Ru87]
MSRWAAAVVLPAEIAVVVCLLAGVRVPAAAVVAAEAAVLALLAAEAVLLARHYRSARSAGYGRGPALRRAAGQLLPVAVRRLLVYELRAMAGVARWVARRPHGVGPGDHGVGYARGQAPMIFLLLFASVVETVVLALVIPWPLVDAIVLVLDLYGVLFVLALHATCVTRPHVAGADGSLRVRYGALFDLRIPAGSITSVRHERRFAAGRLLETGEDGVLSLVVDSQTSVTVELSQPVTAVRPLGRRTPPVRVVRFHADDPRTAVAALRERLADGGARPPEIPPALSVPRDSAVP